MALGVLLFAGSASAEEPPARLPRDAPGIIRLVPGGVPFGLDLVKDGKAVGPGFLAHQLEQTVRGSALAEKHAAQARLWTIVGFSAGLVTLGLMTTDLILHARHNEGRLDGWPTFIPQGSQGGYSGELGVLWAGSATLTVLSRFWANREFVLSVDAYNADVLRRQRGDGASEEQRGTTGVQGAPGE